MKSPMRVFLCAATALLALSSWSDAASDESPKLTPSPALAEAIANGEISIAPAKAFIPPVLDMESSSSSSSATPSIVTQTPSTTKTPSGETASGETAVDSFQSSTGLATNSGSLDTKTILVAGVGSLVGVAAIVMAVMYKRKTQRANDDDEEQQEQEQHHQQQQQQQQRSTTCTFSNADFSPHHGSLDGMLQDDRLTTGSSAMLPIYSSDRIDPSIGLVRVSSPFGANGARISSPAQRNDYSAYSMEFNVAPSQRGDNTVSAGLEERDTNASSSSALTKTGTEAAL